MALYNKAGRPPGLTCSPATHWLARDLINEMERRSLSAVELARHAGIKPATIYQWARGRNTNPTIQNLEALANELGFKIVLVKR